MDSSTPPHHHPSNPPFPIADRPSRRHPQKIQDPPRRLPQYGGKGAGGAARPGDLCSNGCCGNPKECPKTKKAKLGGCMRFEKIKTWSWWKRLENPVREGIGDKGTSVCEGHRVST